MTCSHCRVAVVSDERISFGYTHCPASDCVASWRRHKLMTEYRLDLVPKVGFAISLRDDPNAVGIGKSSGRTT